MTLDLIRRAGLSIAVLGSATAFGAYRAETSPSAAKWEATAARELTNYLDRVVLDGRITVEGVEIDGKITALARQYFAMPEDLPVATYDGRAFLNAVDRQYDVIMVDAYQDITIPFQMASVEFFTLVREHLSDDGVMVVNMNMRGQSEGNINQYLADTISAVFPAVWTVDVARNTNRELFASRNTGMIERLRDNIALVEDDSLRELLQRVSAGLAQYEAGGYVMTDDRAPVELLSMQVIDELIRDEVAYYKDIYEQHGIEALVASVQ